MPADHNGIDTCLRQALRYDPQYMVYLKIHAMSISHANEESNPRISTDVPASFRRATRAMRPIAPMDRWWEAGTPGCVTRSMLFDHPCLKKRHSVLKKVAETESGPRVVAEFQTSFLCGDGA